MFHFEIRTRGRYNQVVIDTKKCCAPPQLTAYDPKDVPEWIQLRVQQLRERVVNASDCTTVVDKNRNYVEVSEKFCKLVGYKAEELIGTPYDHLTVPNTADIPTTYNLFTQFGYMHGLWMLAHRSGYRIVIRYEASKTYNACSSPSLSNTSWVIAPALSDGRFCGSVPEPVEK